jgi:predicted RNase H-like HicB family nuclease
LLEVGLFNPLKWTLVQSLNIVYLLDMERVINLHIEKLPEGVYLATSDSIQGLVAQGRTISETIEIAKDIAKKLSEAQEETISKLTIASDNFDYQMVVGF